MCRIFGIIQSTHTHSYLENLIQVASGLLHGGPDSQGLVHFPIGGIGTTRLAITGLDGGQQPYMQGDVFAVLNGQIYNHKQLRKLLEAKGHTFTDHCDGSLIPALYKEYGESFPSHLNGMFALAVLDMSSTPKLFLAVDGMGIKPLYYAPVADGVAFCSEIAPLSQLTQSALKVESSNISEIFSHRIVMGSKTLYKNVHVLQPGNSLSLTLGEGLHTSLYNPFKTSATSENMSLREILQREMALMTDSETEACFIVSGGVDSSLITALAAQNSSKPLSTFHVCTKNSSAYNENTFAREFANHYGTRHHEVEVDLLDFTDLLTEFTRYLGQPDSAPQSLSAFALAKSIKDHGFKVAYGGEGADELFGGYSRMVQAQAQTRLDTHTYNEALAPFSTHVLPNLFTQQHKQTYPVTQKPIQSVAEMYAFERTQRLPAHLLRRADHLFMASSVEMRVPLCQPTIQDFAQRTHHAGLTAKPHIYEAAKGLVPPSILNRPKHHFVFPIVDAYRSYQCVRSILMDTILSAKYLYREVFNFEYIEKIIQKGPAELTQDEILLIFTLAVYELTVSATSTPPQPATKLHVRSITQLNNGGYHVTLS